MKLNKASIAVVLLSAWPAGAAQKPNVLSPEYLASALLQASQQWNLTEVPDIRPVVVGGTQPDCRRELAWSDMATRTITLNAICKWDESTVMSVLVHEVGHLILGIGHSLDKESIMYFRVWGDGRQIITEEDWGRLKSSPLRWANGQTIIVSAESAEGSEN